MQISKYFLAAGIFIAGLSPVFAQSDTDDSEERAHAREQLNQKMAELESQLQEGEQPKPPMPPSNAEEMQPVPAPPVVVAPPEAKPVEPAAPVITQPVNVTPVISTPAPTQPIDMGGPSVTAKPLATAQPAVTVQPASNDAIARAREEMRRKIAELNNTPMPTTTAVASQPAPMTVAPAPENPAPALLSPSVIPADSDAIARAREEMRRKIAELNGQTPSGGRPETMSAAQPMNVTPSSAATPAAAAGGDSFTTGTVRDASTPPQAEVVAQPASNADRQQAEAQALKVANTTPPPTPTTAMSLIQAPPPAISAAKQIRLNELLDRYKTNKITPEEYHVERAKILAEP